MESAAVLGALRSISIRWLLATVCAVAAVSPAVRAIDLRDVLVGYSFVSWGGQDGLPSGAVRAIAQDHDGYLWVGTDIGLYRFDGARFLAADTVLSTTLPRTATRALHADSDGTLWAGYGTTGTIARIRNGQIITFGENEGLPAGDVNAIARDSEGMLWAGHARGLFRFEANGWHRTPLRGLTDEAVLALQTGRDGLLILATPSGIFRQTGVDRVEQVDRLSSPIRSIVEDERGRLWVPDSGVGFRQVGEQQPPLRLGGPARGVQVLRDRAGNFWIGADGQGLWRVRNADAPSPTIERATVLSGLSTNGATALFEDREGNIWVGGNDSIDRLSRHKADQIQDIGIVLGVDASPDGVFIGTADSVVAYVRRNDAWQPDRTVIRNVRLRTMHVDEAGALWAATSGGLIRMARGGSPQVVSPLGEIEALTSSGPELWAHDAAQGLLRIRNGVVEEVPGPADALRAPVTAMHADRQGRLWIGGNGGVTLRHPDGRFTRFDADDGLDRGVYRVFYEDGVGTIWAGSSEGLSHFNGEHFVSASSPDGLPAQPVMSMSEDSRGQLWIAMREGIVSIGRDALLNAIAHHESARYAMIDRADGTAGSPRWQGTRAATRDTSGRLWFVTSRGVTILDPQRVSTAPPQLSVRIESAVAGDTRVAPIADASLAQGTTRLQIEYTALNLSAAERLRFRYRLEGFDEHWIDAGALRQAVYTNLPPREYRFVVEASQDDRPWEQGAAWTFSLQPRFYETAWFFPLLFAGVAAAGWAGWRLRVRQVKRDFALLLGERTRLSREIHDTLLQSLVGVALQCDALASDANTTEASPLREGLVRLRRQVEEYIRECRQSIWDLRSPRLQGHDLAGALELVARRASDAAGTRLQIDVDGNVRRLSPRVEEQLLRIGQEAVTNAARHAAATQLRLSLHYGADAVVLRITDDGRGFDPADPLHRVSGHCGLASMRERAEAAGGTIDIVSRPGHGTEVEAVIPINFKNSRPDDTSTNSDSLHGRSSTGTRGDRADYQPTA